MKEIQVFLELLKSNFITHLIFAVLSSLLLNCIVGKMNILIGTVFHRELKARCPDVSCRVEVSCDVGSGCDKCKTANIEFSSVKKKRVNVFLYDKSSFRMFFLLFFDIFLDVFYLFTNPNAAPSVRILSWLDDPHQLFLLFPSLNIILILHQLTEIFLALEVKSQRDIAEHIIIFVLTEVLETMIQLFLVG